MCRRADVGPRPPALECHQHRERAHPLRAPPVSSLGPGPASSPPTDYTRARPFAPGRRPGCQLRIISRGGTTPLCQRDPPDRGPALPVRPSTVTARAFGASVPSGRDPSRGPKPRRACWETIEGRRPRGHARMQVPSKCRPRGRQQARPVPGVRDGRDGAGRLAGGVASAQGRGDSGRGRYLNPRP